jgi:23S rRNA (uridine2552-2'-O)-methyltransferase
MAQRPGGKGSRGKGGGSRGPGGRELTVRVRTARGRKTSSTRWLQRQLNDPYVQAAKREGYRSRAAYKLAELDDRFHFLKPGGKIVDLGAAPGGWSQVARQRVGRNGVVLAVDLSEIDALPEIETMVGDIHDPDLGREIEQRIAGKVDVVMSDMAPPSSGHRATDHLRIIALVEAALELAREILAPGGTFIAKVWQGGTENELLAAMKKDFANVRHAKPKASRSDSAEMYVVALDYRGG